MFLAEPPPTQADLNFRLFGFDVRVSPWFWLLAVILGAGGIGGSTAPREILIWVAVVFVSILVHEFGHTLAFRYYGISSHIVLYQFGGLAVPDEVFSGFGGGGNLNPRSQITVSAAGPVAGFILAAFTVAVVYATGERIEFQLGGDRLIRWAFTQRLFDNQILSALVDFLLQVNIFWGLLNLMPIYPLDGGQISRELFLLADSRDGIRKSLILSIGASVGIAVWTMFTLKSILIPVMFGMLAFGSYQMLQGFTGGGGFGGGGFGGGGFGRRNPW